MKDLKWYLVSTVMVIISCIGCRKDEPTQPAQELFFGILITDANCAIVGGDTTDFLPRPTGGGGGTLPTNYSLIKACPNPVIGDTTTIYFQIPVADSVVIRAFATTNAPPLATIVSERLPAGRFQVRWGFNGVNGVYRVQMSTGSGFTSYGDVEFR